MKSDIAKYQENNDIGKSAFKRYWHAYGGSLALVKSLYLWSALALTLVLYPAWSQPGWWSDVISIMPNLLGFSLGGYALWMSIGDDNFKNLIIRNGDKNRPSPYMQVNATFAHFIMLQLFALLTALTAKTFYFTLAESNPFYPLTQTAGFQFFCVAGYAIGYFLFIYALLSALAATLALFRVSSWYDIMKRNNQHL